jgi:hypothetical protein
MFEKLEQAFYGSEGIKPKLAHEKKWGRFNDAPPNFTEITADEFAQGGFFTWVKEGIEFRQISPDTIDMKKMLSPVKYMLGITLFFMNHGDNFGLAQYEGKVRYFKFADCFHEWHEISAKEAGKPAFNCYHYMKCSKCGAQHEYDSSG